MALIILLVSMVFPYAALAGGLSSDFKVAGPDTKRVTGVLTMESAAAAASRRGWPEGSSTVVLVDGSDAAYAAMASPLAAVLDAPVLVTQRALAPSTRREIDRLDAQRVILVGSSGKRTDRVKADLGTLGVTVEPLLGSDPLGTSDLVAARVAATSDAYRVVIAPDGDDRQLLLAAAEAARTGSPLLISDARRLSPSRRDVIRSLGARSVVIVGSSRHFPPDLRTTLESEGLAVAAMGGSVDDVSVRSFEAAIEDDYSVGTTLVLGARVDQALAAPALSARLDAPVLMSTAPSGSESAREALLENCSMIDELLVMGDWRSVPSGAVSRLSYSASTVYRASTVIVREKTIDGNVVAISGTSITTKTELRDLTADKLTRKVAAGDYLVVMPSALRPEGTYGRVTGVACRPLNDGYIYSIVPVAIGEIIQQGGITARQRADLKPDQPGDVNWDGGFKQEIGVSLGLVASVESDGGFKGKCEAGMTGEAKLASELEVHLTIVGGRVSVFEYSFTNTASANVKLTLAGEFKVKSTSKALKKTMRGRPIMLVLGPVPVVLMPTIEYSAYMSGSFAGNLTASYEWKLTRTQGLRIEDGVLAEEIDEGGKGPQATPSSSSHAKVKADLKVVFGEAKCSIKVWGLAGPKLTVTTYAKLSGSIDRNLSTGALIGEASLVVGVEVKAGVEFTVLKLVNLELANVELFSFDLEVLKMSMPGASRAEFKRGLLRLLPGANGRIFIPAMSADGKFVAFTSNATNLVSGISQPGVRAYLLDLASGRVECVSRDSAGRVVETGNFTAVSGDGRYVCFSSSDSQSVWVRDRLARTSELINVTTAGVRFGGASFPYVMSADGSTVIFRSTAQNIVPGVADQLYARNRVRKTTRCVSVDSIGMPIGWRQGTLDSWTGDRGVDLSADGRYVVYCAPWTGAGGTWQVWMLDLHANRSRGVVSVGTNGSATGTWNLAPAVSADGAYVSYLSNDASLNGVVAPYFGVVRQNVKTRSLVYTSRSNSNKVLKGLREDSFVDTDRTGNRVVFTVHTSEGDRVYLRDVSKGKTYSLTSAISPQWDERLRDCSISDDGSRVVFSAITGTRRGMFLYLMSDSWIGAGAL